MPTWKRKVPVSIFYEKWGKNNYPPGNCKILVLLFLASNSFEHIKLILSFLSINKVFFEEKELFHCEKMFTGATISHHHFPLILLVAIHVKTFSVHNQGTAAAILSISQEEMIVTHLSLTLISLYPLTLLQLSNVRMTTKHTMLFVVEVVQNAEHIDYWLRHYHQVFCQKQLLHVGFSGLF